MARASTSYILTIIATEKGKEKEEFAQGFLRLSPKEDGISIEDAVHTITTFKPQPTLVPNYSLKGMCFGMITPSTRIYETGPRTPQRRQMPGATAPELGKHDEMQRSTVPRLKLLKEPRIYWSWPEKHTAHGLISNRC